MNCYLDSERSSQKCAELFTATAAEHQLGSVLKNHAIFVMKPGLQLAHAVDVYDRRAMNSRKLLRVELGFDTADGFTQQVGFLSCVEANVLTFGLDPVYFLGLEKERAAAGLYYQSLDVIGPRFKLCKQRQGLLVQIDAAVVCHAG